MCCRNGTAWQRHDISYNLGATSYSPSQAYYKIEVTFKRINSKGQGTRLAQNLSARAEYHYESTTTTQYMPCAVKFQNGFYVTAQIWITKLQLWVGYSLFAGNLTSGTVYSTSYTSKTETSANRGLLPTDSTRTGYVPLCILGYIVEQILQKGNVASVSLPMLKDLGVCEADGRELTTWNNTVNAFIRDTFIPAAIAAQGEDMTLTYYQIQWAILNEGAYLDAAAAKEACLATYEWCDKVEEEGGDEAAE